MDQESLLKEWSEADFDREVLSFAGRAVVMFGDPRWSSPCHHTRCVLERLASQVPGVLVGIVNISDSTELYLRFRTDAMPTVIVFENGIEVRRVSGWRQDEEWRDLLSGNGTSGDAVG